MTTEKQEQESSGVSVFDGLRKHPCNICILPEQPEGKIRFETKEAFLCEDVERRVTEKIEEICLNCHVKKSFTLNCSNCQLIKFKNEVLK